MDRNETSRHEVAVYHALRDAEGWLTIKEIAERAAVARRTASAHASKLVELGIADRVQVFPGLRYKIAEHAAGRNRGYVDRLEIAAEALGMSGVGNAQ